MSNPKAYPPPPARPAPGIPEPLSTSKSPPLPRPLPISQSNWHRTPLAPRKPNLQISTTNLGHTASQSPTASRERETEHGRIIEGEMTGAYRNRSGTVIWNPGKRKLCFFRHVEDGWYEYLCRAGLLIFVFGGSGDPEINSRAGMYWMLLFSFLSLQSPLISQRKNERKLN